MPNPIGRALRNRRAGPHTLAWARPDLQAPASRGALGRRGWAGPAPIPSHGPHSYVFQLFALDHRPELPDTFTLTDALHSMAGHVVGRARLDGTYEIQ
jgi:phosphatidylethanolamine-binding protein (PEBP) family uncharacterized protein